MKKHRLAAAAAAAILGISAVSSYAAQPLMGGWQAVGSTTVAGDAQAAFDKAVEGLTGAVYEPLDLLATQIVAGTNYCFLCELTPVVLDPVPHYALVYVYAALDGSAQVLSVVDLDLGL